MLEYLFNKVTALKACNFIQKRRQHSRFPMFITNFLRTPILKNICEPLLLKLWKVSKERENYRREIKRNSQGAYEVISSLRSQIETLQSEVYFLRDELKEKNALIKSLIAPYTLTIEQRIQDKRT